VPRLPSDPSLEHLKKQAKTLLARARARDDEALRWVREYHPDPPAELRLAGAQLVVARAYGFPSWPKLRAHLEVIERYTRNPHRVERAADPADEFLRLASLTYSSDDPARWAAAATMLAEHPELAHASLHAAAAAGDAAAACALLAEAARDEAAAAGGATAARALLAEAARDEAAAAGDATAARALLAEAARDEAAAAGGAGSAGDDAAQAVDGGGDAGPSSDDAAAALGEQADREAATGAATVRGRVGAARRGVVAAVNAPGGPHRWEPLLYLTYSRATGDGALEVARLLLDAGADPNAGYLWEGLPSPFTALTGAFGRGEGDPPPHRDSLALARLLLEAGADANDTQATYNLSFTPGDAWLELLLEFGYGRGDGGPWHARLAPAHADPRENAEDALMWAAVYGFASRVRLLLGAGVDPDGVGTRHPILKGQSALGVALLEGHADAAAVLREAGASEPELGEAQRIEAAYMRGEAAGPPPPGLIVRAAANGREDVARLLLSHGAGVNEYDARATALHEAAFHGNEALVALLLEHGADARLRDRAYDATPAGWAEHAGFVELAERLRSRELTGPANGG
jgi:hypothetical protein